MRKGMSRFGQLYFQVFPFVVGALSIDQFGLGEKRIKAFDHDF